MLTSNSKNGNTKIERLIKERFEDILQRFEDVRASLQQEIDQEYQQNGMKSNEEKITFEQYSEMKQQINYDVAWQIFDEVNKYYDVSKYIDLNCLDLVDAQAVTKQKIYDVAMMA